MGRTFKIILHEKYKRNPKTGGFFVRDIHEPLEFIQEDEESKTIKDIKEFVRDQSEILKDNFCPCFLYIYINITHITKKMGMCLLLVTTLMTHF